MEFKMQYCKIKNTPPCWFFCNFAGWVRLCYLNPNCHLERISRFSLSVKVFTPSAFLFVFQLLKREIGVHFALEKISVNEENLREYYIIFLEWKIKAIVVLGTQLRYSQTFAKESIFPEERFRAVTKLLVRIPEVRVYSKKFL